jgi:hypothetical protein
MQSKIVALPTKDISDWSSFHEVFATVFGFPDFYGRNMNAWIDCMTYVDDLGAGMSTVTVAADELLVLSVADAPDFKMRCPEQYEALLECAAFVNYRRAEAGRRPSIALMLSGHFNKGRR